MFDFKKLIGDYFGFNLEIARLQSQYNALLLDADDKLVELNLQIKNLLDGDLSNKAKIVELNKLLDESAKESLIEKEIVSKRPQRNRYYQRQETDGSYSIDVRNYLTPYDSSLPVIAGTTNDQKALQGLLWVRKNLSYTADKTVYSFDEYWAYPYQSLKRRQGDCDDGAILLASILLKNNVPYYRVRVCAGSVNGGGHAYCVYCRETDNEWVVLDWCYWPNSLPVADRKMHKEEPNYVSLDGKYYVWFSWDMKHTYAEEKLPNVARGIFSDTK